MEAIAFIYGETFVYWQSIFLALAAAVAACVFVSVYLGSSGNAVGAAMVVPMALTASMVLSRLLHWYCRADRYESLVLALTDYSRGGYALAGAFAGCVLVACILRMIRVVKNLPQLLDAMAIAAAAGIPVGRLACFFNAENRGMTVNGSIELPFVCEMVNAVSGATEYRVATFLLQAACTAGICLILLLIYLIGKRLRRMPDGDVTLLFMLLYGASQIVLDSMRYDSLFLRSNGFISLVQILGAVGVVVPLVLFSVRLVRRCGWSKWYLLWWFLCAAALAGAGYMEYYVQRHGDEALLAYSVMSGCLLLVLLVTAGLRLAAMRQKKE